jgi:hypothetical protein
MDTDEIQRYVKDTKALVCASDQLPQHKIKSGIYISNTDELSKSGLHWVLLAVLETKVIYFDTLAVPPLIEYFYKFLKCNVVGKELELNKNVIQSEQSSFCGAYCILLCWHLHEGGTFEEFCKQFSASPLINDKKLEGRFALFLEWYKSRHGTKKT